jgi:hypothetical protein
MSEKEQQEPIDVNEIEVSYILIQSNLIIEMN